MLQTSLNRNRLDVPQLQPQPQQHQQPNEHHEYNDDFGAGNFDDTNEYATALNATSAATTTTTTMTTTTATTAAPDSVLRQGPLTTSTTGVTLDELCSSKSAFAALLRKRGAYELLLNSTRGMPPAARISTSKKTKKSVKVRGNFLCCFYSLV